MMERPVSSSLPTTPGVYLYRDERGMIIYVGKARNLRKRILSYFRDASALSVKTLAMLRHAVSVETLSTGTEKEALLLEASLIKKHRPHYNIVLRDDKQYVLFRIDREAAYPRLEIVRQAKASHGKSGRVVCFGPFASGLAARETWKTIHRAFPLRRCTDRVFANRVRPCLYYHIGQCLAPCTEEVSPERYHALIRRVELLLSGRSRELLESLRQAMLEASDALDFEHAAELRDQIRAVESTVERQSVVLPEGGDMDVCGITPVRGGLGLGVLFVREGRLMDGQTFFWPGLELADAEESLWSFLPQFYGPRSPVPPRVVVPWLPSPDGDSPHEGCPVAGSPDESPEPGLPETSVDVETLHALEAALSDARDAPVRISLPRNMAEADLIDMAVSNAREAVNTRRERPVSEGLAAVFRTENPIRRVECVDVSHTGGRSTRIGMVVFEDGKPLKSEYRTYALRPEDGLGIAGDDYAALAIWMRRRLEAGPPWADLVLIDGGRGQVGAVHRVVSENGDGVSFLLAGIAKARDATGRADRRAGNLKDRIFLPGRSKPLPLPEGSPELLFLQHVRDTAHRHAIGRHRRARAEATLSGELLRIPGIGPATARLLWQHFPSLEAMLAASGEELASIPGIGPARAALLVRRLAMLSIG